MRQPELAQPQRIPAFVPMGPKRLRLLYVRQVRGPTTLAARACRESRPLVPLRGGMTRVWQPVGRAGVAVLDLLGDPPSRAPPAPEDFRPWTWGSSRRSVCGVGA